MVKPDILKGNPDFNIEAVSPDLKRATEMAIRKMTLDYESPSDEALNHGPTAEDLELDRALERINQETKLEFNEGGNEGAVVKPKDIPNFLGEMVDDYKPAETIAQLMDQVHLAKQYDLDSIEATPGVVRHYCRKVYPSDVGYFIYNDIKVYIAGFYQEKSKRDKMDMNQKLFGNSKVK